MSNDCCIPIRLKWKQSAHSLTYCLADSVKINIWSILREVLQTKVISATSIADYKLIVSSPSISKIPQMIEVDL